ncbi:MAG TPA: ribosomal protein S18-alanine N-acetyltransferase [Terriglobia bacterium]
MPNSTGESDRRPATIIIRELTPIDLPAILEIQQAAREVAHWAAEDYGSLTREPGGLVLVAASNHARATLGATVGFAAARAIGAEAELQNLAVRTEYRRHGVARSLVEDLHRRLAAAGVERVCLEVRVSNLPARSLYRSFDYTECGLRRSYYASDGEDALVLELRLKRGAQPPASAPTAMSGD